MAVAVLDLMPSAVDPFEPLDPNHILTLGKETKYLPDDPIGELPPQVRAALHFSLKYGRERRERAMHAAATAAVNFFHVAIEITFEAALAQLIHMKHPRLVERLTSDISLTLKNVQGGEVPRIIDAALAGGADKIGRKSLPGKV